MKENPILMSAPMVRALLDGTKTQTRRIVKPQPARCPRGVLMWSTGKYSRFGVEGIDVPAEMLLKRCPFGRSGDRLWVRETWAPDPPIDDSWASTAWSGCGRMISEVPERFQHPRFCNYQAVWLHGPIKWRPSIHMPRWASRITLEVTGVRVERLNDISEADAIAEGADCWVCGGPIDGTSENDCACFHTKAAARDSYRALWEQINGAGSWDANPFCWVIEFKRLKVSEPHE